MTKCKVCGSEITFKNVGGVFHPVNIDGSAHHDVCRTISNKNVIKLGREFTDKQGDGYLDKNDKKLYMKMSSAAIRGINYVESNCDCIPWEDCKKCA